MTVEIERIDVVVTYTAGNPPGWRDSLIIPYEEWTGDFSDEHLAEIQTRITQAVNPSQSESIVVEPEDARNAVITASTALRIALDALDVSQAAQAEVEVVE
jgi:hypothetical protein